MALTKTVTLLVGAAALAVAPALTPDLPFFKPVDKAFAKNGNSGGNGNGGGNGNAGGNGNGGGKGNSGNAGKSGKSASNGSTNKGKGLFNRGNGSKQANSGNGRGLGGFLNSVFGTQNNSGKRRTASTGGGKSSSHRLAKTERATLTSVSVTPSASPFGKEKNFNAKLGRLNSLKRNYHAYINSKDPHLAAVVAYISATLDYERLTETLSGLELDLAAARDLLDPALADIEPYDDFAYQELTSEELEARLAALDAVDTSELTQEQIAALDAERLALSETLASEEYVSFKDAETAYLDKQEGLETLEGAVSDEALADALLSMANENRVREYGDEYVDDEMLDWAKQVLGVGDFEGKIDEIREATVEDDVETAPAAPDAESDTSDDALLLTETTE